uniref:DUF4099 domain-containing protein n=3 Tax=unclassified Prevotella TaxID=2638335 RepID=A0AB33JTM1_9BACT
MEKKINIPFKVEEVDWRELAVIGVRKEDIKKQGELDTLLSGEQTGVVTLSLVLFGVDVVMDATLRLVRKDGAPLLEVNGVKNARIA